MISFGGKGASNVDAVSVQQASFTGLSSAACGEVLLEQFGLTSLEARKNTFLNDPGTFVAMKGGELDSSHLRSHASDGWLVVESCEGDNRGTLFTTASGAIAQVWSILSMQDSVSLQPQVLLSLKDIVSSAASSLSFTMVGPLGVKSLHLANLSRE